MFLLFIILPTLVYSRNYHNLDTTDDKKLCLFNVSSEEQSGNFTEKTIYCATSCCEDTCCPVEPWAIVLYVFAGICVSYAIIQSIASFRKKKVISCSSKVEGQR